MTTRRLLWIACTALYAAIGINSCTIARADGDDEPRIPRRATYGAKEFQCGAVTLRYEIREGAGWWQSRYQVINPDGIPYIHDGPAPYYFVEWNSSQKYGEYVTLNGWQCAERKNGQ